MEAITVVVPARSLRPEVLRDVLDALDIPSPSLCILGEVSRSPSRFTKIFHILLSLARQVLDSTSVLDSRVVPIIDASGGLGRLMLGPSRLLVGHRS